MFGTLEISLHWFQLADCLIQYLAAEVVSCGMCLATFVFSNGGEI